MTTKYKILKSCRGRCWVCVCLCATSAWKNTSPPICTMPEVCDVANAVERSPSAATTKSQQIGRQKQIPIEQTRHKHRSGAFKILWIRSNMAKYDEMKNVACTLEHFDDDFFGSCAPSISLRRICGIGSSEMHRLQHTTSLSDTNGFVIWINILLFSRLVGMVNLNAMENCERQ